MEWSQLQYFQKVAQLQHFTQAAEALSISQPALSRSIARLEEELGVPLFERQGRTVSLNHFGQLFQKRVNQAIMEIFEGQQEIHNLINPYSGNISIGFVHTLGTNLVPDLLGKFQNNFPKITFQLFQNSSRKIFDQLTSGEIDFCLGSPPSESGNIHWEKLLTEELYIIVPKGHRLAREKNIKLKEIAEDSFIALKKETGLREITDRVCSEADFTPKVTFEGEEVSTVAGLVAANLGVALVPQAKGMDMSKIARLQVSEPLCRRDIGLAWINDRYMSPAGEGFKEFVLGHYI